MSTGSVQRIGEVMPIDAWAILKSENDARLIDVRTQAEWDFVGVPDLSEIGQTLICVQWASFPGMSANTHFVEVVMDEWGPGRAGNFCFYVALVFDPCMLLKQSLATCLQKVWRVSALMLPKGSKVTWITMGTVEIAMGGKTGGWHGASPDI